MAGNFVASSYGGSMFYLYFCFFIIILQISMMLHHSHISLVPRTFLIHPQNSYTLLLALLSHVFTYIYIYMYTHVY